MLLKFISVYLELGPKGEPCQPFCPILLAITASPIPLLAKHAATAQPEAVVPQSRGLLLLFPLRVFGELAFLHLNDPTLSLTVQNPGTGDELAQSLLTFLPHTSSFLQHILSPKADSTVTLC